MPNFIITTICVLLLAFLTVPAAHADQVDDYVKAQMQKQEIPGLSLAVVHDGNVVIERGYGLADVEHGIAATPETVYEIGSITKQFTATAIMMLVEEGEIGLDDKIDAYLPNLPAAWSGVTVRHLLTQTSGIKDYLDTPDSAQRSQNDMTHEEVIKSVSDVQPAFPPGTKWAYSNTNYFLLGMILEKASGKPYGTFLEARIFKPLGMTATRVNDLSASIPHRAEGYTLDGKTLRPADAVSMTWAYSAGVLVSTVKDLVTWDAALAAAPSRLLKPADLRQMWKPAKLNDGTATTYGFGWVVDDVNGRRRLWHNGGIPGFVTDISRFVDDKLTVIVLTNTDQASPDGIAQGVAGLVVPALAPPKPIKDTDSQATQMLRAVLLDLQDGKANPDDYTPEMLAAITPQLPKQSAALKSLGALQSFQPVAQKTRAAIRVYDYRAVFGDTPLSVHATLTEDGKVTGLRCQPE